MGGRQHIVERIEARGQRVFAGSAILDDEHTAWRAVYEGEPLGKARRRPNPLDSHSVEQLHGIGIGLQNGGDRFEGLLPRVV